MWSFLPYYPWTIFKDFKNRYHIDTRIDLAYQARCGTLCHSAYSVQLPIAGRYMTAMNIPSGIVGRHARVYVHVLFMLCRIRISCRELGIQKEQRESVRRTSIHLNVLSSMSTLAVRRSIRLIYPDGWMVRLTKQIFYIYIICRIMTNINQCAKQLITRVNVHVLRIAVRIYV